MQGNGVRIGKLLASFLALAMWTCFWVGAVGSLDLLYSYYQRLLLWYLWLLRWVLYFFFTDSFILHAASISCKNDAKDKFSYVLDILNHAMRQTSIKTSSVTEPQQSSTRSWKSFKYALKSSLGYWWVLPKMQSSIVKYGFHPCYSSGISYYPCLIV